MTYDLVSIALDPFLAGLDALVVPQAAAKSLALGYARSDEWLGVLADREKLRQILPNLLSNAIRYTPPGGRIDVTAKAVDDDMVAIAARDTGVGIAPDALQHSFEPFVQLDRSLTQVRDGIGLGLAISLDLAHGMGGALTVESRRGEGSCFTLTLPRATVEEGATSVALASGEYPAVRSVAPP